MKRLIAALSAGLVLATAGFVVHAQAPAPKPPADALTDPAMKGPEVLAFIGLKPGDRVADIIAGRFVRAESGKVGPKGKVYAVMPEEIVKPHPEGLAALNKTVADPAYANVVISTKGPLMPSRPRCQRTSSSAIHGWSTCEPSSAAELAR